MLNFKYFFPGSQHKYFTCGTLKYTLGGMVILFIWLLWGDFIFNIFDIALLQQVMPLKLKALGASDTLNAVVNKSLAAFIAFFMTPFISFRSDRHRGKKGRRIPFLRWSTPFVGLFMVLMGFSDSFAALLSGTSQVFQVAGLTITKPALTLIIISIFLVGFDFTASFVNTLFWYLINDVVPQKVMSRFIAMFKITGFLAVMLFNKYIFPSSLDHFRIIFAVSGAAYVIGFMIMCFAVKEGEYPGPHAEEQPGFIPAIKTYWRECFSHRIYILVFFTSVFYLLSSASSNFAILRNTASLRLSMKDVGNMNFYTGIVNMALLFPAAWLADRFHPLRTFLWGLVAYFILHLSQCIWIFKGFGETNLPLLYVFTIAQNCITAVLVTSEIPVYMRIFPREKYGQFCGANAMIRTLFFIPGSVLAGYFFDLISKVTGPGDQQYRYYPLWTAAVILPGIFFAYLLLKEWKTLGGDNGFSAPAVLPPPTPIDDCV